MPAMLHFSPQYRTAHKVKQKCLIVDSERSMGWVMGWSDNLRLWQHAESQDKVVDSFDWVVGGVVG